MNVTDVILSLIHIWIVELLGNPHDWEKQIKFKVKQITKGDRSILTFEPVVK